jgi:O-acetyl-ADP-ribose deacetylase (regulator of RNase III)
VLTEINATLISVDFSSFVIVCVSGGRVIQEECSAHVKSAGQLKTSELFVSKPGRLPCKAIIHAVGPMWTDGRHNEVNLLYSTVFNVLEEADRRKFSSIALPAISTGVYHFPVDSAARCILEAIGEFSKKPPVHLSEVHIMDNNSSTTTYFKKAAAEIFKGASVKAVDEIPFAGDKQSYITGTIDAKKAMKACK